MNIPAKIIAEYVSTEECEIDPQQVWKALEAIKMMVEIKNTSRIVNALEKLDETMMLQVHSKQSGA